MPRPIAAHIDIDAMRSNLAVAKAYAPDSKLWAVVKANAYGHGLKHAMRGFEAADGFALVEPEAAIGLRRSGVSKPILLLEGFFDNADLSAVLMHDLQTVVHCEEQLAMLEMANHSTPLTGRRGGGGGGGRRGGRPGGGGGAEAR